MILPKLKLTLLLITALSRVNAIDPHDDRIRIKLANSEKRQLKSSSYDELEATIENKYKSWTSLGGSIQLEFNYNDQFNVNYHLHDLPKYCDTCYFSIMDEESCDKYFNEDDHYHKDYVTPFSNDLTGLISDKNGDAIGAFIDVDNGNSAYKNTCKAAVIWAEVEGRSSKSGKRGKRGLVSTGEKINRRTGSKKMRVVGCGLLKRKGYHYDC